MLLIGGGARSAAVRALAPGIFGAPVLVPEPEEYVALGAARQAAWALAGHAGAAGLAAPARANTPARRSRRSGSATPAARDATATWDGRHGLGPPGPAATTKDGQ